MAAAAAYFPSLDQCLSSAPSPTTLIPWQTTYALLRDLPAALRSSTLEHFFHTPEALRLLRNAHDPFTAPSRASRAAFDTRTAAIHVPQSRDGGYDWEQLKSDALWLSEQVGIEEEAGLRCVLVEWGRRSADALVLEVMGGVRGGERVKLDINDEAGRRSRVLQTFVAERQAILGIAAELVGWAARDRRREEDEWIDLLAEKVASAQRSGDVQQTLLGLIAKTRECLEQLDDSSRRPAPFRLDQERGDVFNTAMLVRMTDLMRLILAHLHTLECMPRADVVTAWFSFMEDVAFLAFLQPTATLQDVSVLQCVTSIVSLAILKLPQTVERIASLVEGAQYPDLNKPYIDDQACVQTVTRVLCLAAENGISLAAFAIYAWALLARLVRDEAAIQRLNREERELRQLTEDGSSDTEAAEHNLRRASTVQQTEIENRWHQWFSEVRDVHLAAEEDLVIHLLKLSVDHLRVYVLVPQIIDTFSTAYSGQLDYTTSFLARDSLYHLLRQGLRTAPYAEECLDAYIALVNPHPGNINDNTEEEDDRFASFPTRFLSDTDGFLPTILDQAFSRYPYELSPVLRFCTALSKAEAPYALGQPLIVSALEDLQTLTLMVPENFRGYSLDEDDDVSVAGGGESNGNNGGNRIILNADLAVFAPKRQESFYGAARLLMDREVHRASAEGPRNIKIVPAGTLGVVVKETRPMVLTLRHPHSGLEYCGLLLSTLLPASELVEALPGVKGGLDKATGAEVVALMTALLAAALRQGIGTEEALFVLGRLGYALKEERDIVSVISELFELELLSYLDAAGGGGQESLDFLIACAEFFVQLMRVSPERVWSSLAHSCLLGLNGGSSALAAVVAAQEVGTGSFRFLVACMRLMGECFRDAVAGLVRRRIRSSTSLSTAGARGGRFDSPMLGAGLDETAERTIEGVLGGWARVGVDVVQGLDNWRVESAEEKAQVLEEVLGAFEGVVRWTFGLEEPVTPPNQNGHVKREKISKPLVPAAKSVLAAFSPAAKGAESPVLDSLRRVLLEGVAVSDVLIPAAQREALVAQVKATASFLTRLLRTTQATSPAAAYACATNLLRSGPVLALLYSAPCGPFKSDISSLLAVLARALACTDADPQSLLSGLTPAAAKNFLAVVSKLDGPVKSWAVEVEVWDFLTAVLESKQGWFGVYLLTGELPKERLKGARQQDEEGRKSSLLNHALNELSKISDLIPGRAKALLRFVAATQRTWIWATQTVRQHQHLLSALLNWLESLKPPPQKRATANTHVQTSELQAAAYVCDILAINLHASLEIGDTSLLKALAPELNFLSLNAVRVDVYNRSLHHNLARNLSDRYPGVELSDFRRAKGNEFGHGSSFFYDLGFANRVLGYQALAWEGRDESRQTGFAHEFELANRNLSLYDAQVNLLGSWKTLATTLAECVGMKDGEAVQQPLVDCVHTCTLANVQARLDEPGAGELLVERVELMFVVLGKLVGVKCEKEGMREVLTGITQILDGAGSTRHTPGIWELVLACERDYETATNQEELGYWRLVVQVLWLAVKVHGYAALPTLPAAAPADDEGSSSRPTASKIQQLPDEVAAILPAIVTRTIAPSFRALCNNLHTDPLLALPADFALVTSLLQTILSVRGVQILWPHLAEAAANSELIRGAVSLYTWSDRLAIELTAGEPIYATIALKMLVTLSTVPQIAEAIALQGVLGQLAGAQLSQAFRRRGGLGPLDEPVGVFGLWTDGFLPLCLNLLDAVGPPVVGEVAGFLNAFQEQLERAETAFRTDAPSARFGGRHSGQVTLSLVREAQNLCAIGLMIKSDLERGAAEGINVADVQALQYDVENAREEMKKLDRTGLAGKIVPVGEWEERLALEGRLVGLAEGEVKATLSLFE